MRVCFCGLMQIMPKLLVLFQGEMESLLSQNEALHAVLKSRLQVQHGSCSSSGFDPIGVVVSQSWTTNQLRPAIINAIDEVFEVGHQPHSWFSDALTLLASRAIDWLLGCSARPWACDSASRRSPACCCSTSRRP